MPSATMVIRVAAWLGRPKSLF